MTLYEPTLASAVFTLNVLFVMILKHCLVSVGT